MLLHKTSGSGYLTSGLLKMCDYLGVCNRIFSKTQFFRSPWHWVLRYCGIQNDSDLVQIILY